MPELTLGFHGAVLDGRIGAVSEIWQEGLENPISEVLVVQLNRV